jgi:hypothetical protein
MKQFGGNVFVEGLLFYWFARKDCANHADRIDRSHAPLLECTNATIGRWRVQDLWEDEVKHNWDRLLRSGASSLVVLRILLLTDKQLFINPYVDNDYKKDANTYGPDRPPIQGFRNDYAARIEFDPWRFWRLEDASDPGSHREEILLHELVHALRIMKGLRSVKPLPERNGYKFDNVEEFYAIQITNMFSSENGLKLRKDHSIDYTELTNERDILDDAQYKGLFIQFAKDDRVLTDGLKTVPSRYNPFRDLGV